MSDYAQSSRAQLIERIKALEKATLDTQQLSEREREVAEAALRDSAERLRAMQREQVRLAELFASWVKAHPEWELVAPQRFSLVCFRRLGSDEENEQILERANRSGEMFLSHTKLDGRYVMRLAIGNARTTEADVRRAWEVLNG